MKSIEWIDQLIEAKKLPSDRQAALLLGMTTASMSAHRKGKAVTLDDRYAYRIEEMLGLPHGRIVLDQHAERERDPEISAMWRRLAATAASIFFAVAFCGLVFAPNSAEAKNIAKNQQLNSIYIMRSLRARIRRALQLIRGYTSRQLLYGVNSHGFSGNFVRS